MRRVLFVDRGGTLVQERQSLADSLEHRPLVSGVIPALLKLKAAGYEFVIVTNQGGLGSPDFPRAAYERADELLLDLFASQGIRFAANFICPHLPEAHCTCRKPGIGLVRDFVNAAPLDRERSAMVGDRDTDLEFAANLGIQGFKLVTKLPAIPAGFDDVSGWVRGQVDASLTRLGVKGVYGVLLHRPEQLFESHGRAIYQALQGLKEAGQVQKVGVSIYAPSELEALTPRYRFDLIQAPFNLVDRRLHATGWLRRLKDEGIEIHTRSAFLQGLLLMPQATRPAKFSSWSELWRAWHEWLSRHNVSALQVCLAFPLSFSEINRVVVGADSVSQLREIITAVTSSAQVDFPDLHCEAENLINPFLWSHL